MNVIAQASDYAPPVAAIGSRQGKALIIGILGLAVAAGGFFYDRPHFYQAWLIGFIFWATIALGCLGLTMLHHLTRGDWGLMIRRPLEAASGTLPLLALFFVPLIFGIHDLYTWSHLDIVKADPLLAHKAWYLSPKGFVLRTAICFALWMFWAWRLRTLSRRQDVTADPMMFRKLQFWSAPGFLMLALTLTFASIDWIMSLDPHWFSSIWGLWFFAGTGLSGLAFTILIARWLSNRPPMEGVYTRRNFHDYGKLLFAFVMLWAYLGFSQLLLIWAGNLPEEITFYLPRLKGAWTAMSLFILLAHFVLPFLLLLSASLKQRKAALMTVAAWLLVARWLDYYWNIVPTLQAQRGVTHLLSGLWIDLAVLIGMGGVWLWYFFQQLKGRPLLPINDPFLPEALAHE